MGAMHDGYIHAVPISQKGMLRLNKVKDLGGGPATGVMAQHCVHS